MGPRRVLREALVGAALAACAPMAAHAQLAAGRQVTMIQTVTTSTYLNGGIGFDEQAAMHRAVKGLSAADIVFRA